MSDSGQPNIPLLLQRLKVAMLPTEKQQIVGTLKDLARSPQQIKEIGRVALPQLVDTLCRESSQEVVTDVVELLSTLVTPTQGSSSSSSSTATTSTATAAVADQSPLINTEFLLQDFIAVDKLLSLLREKDKLWLRLNAVQLLRTLADNRPQMMGETIAAIDAGIMRLVDVLNDQREEVRNELLLLLICLTEKNEDIQNFCAFNEVYDRLFAIMEDEEQMTGPIVQDCLQVIGNTLAGNLLTCKIFAASRCCREVLSLLRLEALLAEVPQQALHSDGLLNKTMFKHALRIASSLVAAVRACGDAGDVAWWCDAERMLWWSHRPYNSACVRY
jgi:hypothetical protein